MNKQIKLLLFLFLNIFLVHEIFCQNSLSRPEIKIGATYGWPKYYSNWQTTHEEYVDFYSDIYETPDIRYFKFFTEITTKKKFAYQVGVGYKEFWNGIFVKNPVEESIVLQPNVGLNSNVGNYTLIDMNIGFIKSIRSFEVKPYVGISNFFISSKTYYWSTIGPFNDILVGPITTVQTKNYFFTLDGGLNLRFWVKRIGIGFGWHYSQGLIKMNETNGDYQWKNNTGSISGFSNGTHSTIEMQVLYKLTK